MREAVSKIKLNISKAVLSPAVVKLQAGSREHLCPPSCAEVLPWARRGPTPALSSLLAGKQQLPDEKLV